LFSNPDELASSIPDTTPAPRLPPESEESAVGLYEEEDEDTNVDDLEDLLEDGGATQHRGSRPPRPSSSRRLSPTLMKIFQRRRYQIGLSIPQVAELAGLEQEELTRFEATNGQHRLLYDHVVVVARVLGLRPHELPGLRRKEPRDVVPAQLETLQRTLLTGPLLTFEGKPGERFVGDLDRALTAPEFSLRIGDRTLGDPWPEGALLGFVADANPRRGDVVLLRHRKSKQLALRRLSPPVYAPLAPWMPSLMLDADWIAIGRVNVILPRIP
jgi:hypothetical protein